MSRFLKGNYEVPDLSTAPEPEEPASPTLTEQFEKAALAVLGGSIAFVSKEKSFVWRGPSRPDDQGSSKPK